MIELCNLTKRFGAQTVLKNFSLSLPFSGVTCFFGPSGCGKTTLLRLIAALERPDEGSVSGVPGRVAFVFAEDRLIPWMSAQENVAIVADEKSARECIARVGLSGSGDKYPLELSGGMRRRASLARALAFGGELLILDEPTKGLDAHSSMELLGEIDAPALLVTHNLEEAARIAREVIFLKGPPLEVAARVNVSSLPGGFDNRLKELSAVSAASLTQS